MAYKYNPNYEIVKVQVPNGQNFATQLWGLTPTNVVEGDKGGYALGGKPELLYDSRSGVSAQDAGFQLSGYQSVDPGYVEGYSKQAVKSDSQISDELTKTFASFGASPEAFNYLVKNKDALVKEAKDVLSKDPSHTQVYGELWNKYRYDPNTRTLPTQQPQQPQQSQTPMGSVTGVGPSQPGSNQGILGTLSNLSTSGVDQFASQVDPNAKVTVTNPATGETRSVFASQAGGFTKQGWTITPSPGQSSSQLPSSADKLLDVLQEKITNSIINPDVEVSPSMIAGFLTQAKSELAPYYGQLISQAEQDLQKGFEQIGQDLTARELSLEKQYGQQLEATQENLAQRGLTFSTKRATAEQGLAETTQAAIEAGRQEALRKASEIGTAGERYLGSTQFPTQKLAPAMSLAGAPKPILGQPGVYGFQKPKETQSLFAPIGSTTGTLQQEQLTAEKKRQAELTNAERELRGIYTI